MGRFAPRLWNRFIPRFEVLEDRFLPAVTLSLLDNDGDGSTETLQILGDDAVQVLDIEARHDRTTVSLDSNGDGDFGDPGELNNATLDVFTHFDIQLAGGDDDFYFHPNGTFNSRSLTAFIDMGSGHDAFEMNDGTQAMVSSQLHVDIYGGDGDDWVRTDDFPWIQEGSTWEVNVFLGTGNNRVRANSDTELSGGSILHEYIEGSNLVGDVDTVYFRLNTDVLDTSALTFDVQLLAGSDGFEVEVPTQFNAWGGEVHVTADGGAGNDTLTVWNWEDDDGWGMAVDGLVDFDLKGGTGSDLVDINLNAGDGLELDGELRVRVDGGEGGDQLTATLRNTSGSTGNYDLAFWGSDGDDILHLTLDDAGAPYMDYKNSTTAAPNDQFVLLDGGAGTGDKGTSDVTAGVPVQTVNCELGLGDTVVTIAAYDANAAELLNDPGRFTFTRWGPTTDPLVVPYTVSGTATPGTSSTDDYEALTSGFVTIPAGETTATLTVVPRDDIDIEATETVIVTLSSGTGYFVGSPNTATVRIEDDDPNTSPTFIPAGAVWKYRDNGVDQGTAWRQPGFDDSAWGSGPAQLGFGDGDEATVLASGRMTYYFRRAFTINSVSLISTLNLQVLRDDGAVVYLNGTEIYRTNMPSGTIAYSTKASTSTQDENVFFAITVDPALLVQGTNWLAVEVHQSSSASSDVSFDLSLTGTSTLPELTVAATDSTATEPGADTATFTITRTGDTTYALEIPYTVSGTATSGTDYVALPASVTMPSGVSSVTVMVTPNNDLDNEGSETVILTLSPGVGYTLGAATSAEAAIADDLVDSLTESVVMPGAVWKYLDNGSNQGTAWRAPAFDDGAWNSGAAKLGFSSGQATTLTSGFTTYYFRRSFDIADASAYESLKVRLLRDDGAVVYLNGTEVFRSNMPAGAILYTTRATTGTSGADENTFFEANISPSLLVSGTNVLSVEVHQVVASSADLGFNLELRATRPVPLATVTITATDDTASENGPDGATFTINRDGGDTSIPLTVDYTVGGTATNGTDYTDVPASVTLPIGVTSMTISVAPADDADSESGETIDVTLLSSSAYIVGAASTATVTLVDNDEQVSVTATDADAAEPDGTATLTFTRNGNASLPLTVAYTLSGTAASSDYTGPTGTVTIPAGSASADVTVNVIDDTEAEDTELLTLTLTPNTAYVVGTPAAADVSILDDGDLPVVAMIAADPLAAEAGAEAGSFTFTRNGPTVNPLTINYAVSGTAAGADYDDTVIQQGTVTIPAGAASITVQVVPVDDAEAELDETVTLNLAAGAGYVLGAAVDGTVTIAENDLPTVTVDATDAGAAEAGPDTGTFTFTRNGPTVNPLTVTYTLGGTATSGDYTGPTGTIVIPAGASSATVTVTPVADAVAETAESVSATVNGGSSYLAGPSASIGILEYRNLISAGSTWKYLDTGTNQGTAWQAIGFNDAAWPSGNAQFGFGDGDEAQVVTSGKVTYYFRRAFTIADASQISGLKLRLLRDDGAVVYVNGSEVFRSNMPTGTISYNTPASSSVFGAAETQFFEENISSSLLVNGTNVVAVEVHQIGAANTDLSFDFELLGTLLPATVTLAPADASAAEQGQEPASFTITRTGDSAAPLEVLYSLGGTASSADYTGATGVATIPAGASSTTVTVTPQDDAELEDDETVVASLISSPTYVVGAAADATLTIVENELPIVSIAATDTGAAEHDQDPGTFVLTRIGRLSQPLSVNYTVSGTAAGGTGGSGDYDALPGSVTFAAGSDTAVITLTPHNDAEAEAAETVVLTLAANTAYALGTPDAATVDILDNDTVITITATDAVAAEAGSDQGTLTFTRTGATDAELTVAYTVGGSATAGSDYQALSGSVTFDAGAATAIVTVTPQDDSEAETGESVTATLAASTAYTLGTASSATVTIVDNETVVTIAATDAAAAETAADPAVFTLTRTGSTTEALTVNYTVSGTADGSDYATLSGNVTFAAGSDTATIVLTPNDDADVEAGENAVITLSASSAYTLGSPDSATAGIVDNDTMVTVAATDATAAELGNEPGTFTFMRSGNLTESLTVAYTVGGSASAGTGSGDYETLSGTVTFAAGSDTATISVVPNDDAEVESAETVVVTLSESNAYTVGTPATATIAVLDNDAVVTITATDADAVEAGTDSGTLTLTRVGSITSSLTVAYTVGGTSNSADYEALSGSVTFDAGSDTAVITVTPIDDVQAEPFESVIITLSAGGGYTVGTPAGATVTLLDNDTVVSISATDAAAAEAGSASGTLTLTRAGDASAALSVAYTVGGTAGSGDHDALPGTATFAAGQDTLTLTITPQDDAAVEDTETVIVTLAAGNAYTVGTPDNATLTILDNDTVVTVTATDADAAEANGDPGTFTLTRVGNTTSPLTVLYTLGGTSDSSDYEALSGSVTFDAGSDTALITVTPQDDPTAEPFETVVITVSANSAYTVGTPATATVNILDNDTLVSIAATDADAAEANADAGVFTLTRTGDNSAVLTVAYTIGGTAVGGVGSGDYEALSGSVTFDAGSNTAAVTVTPQDDLEVEDNETVVVTLSAGNAYTLGASSDATVSILDNDTVVTLAATDTDAAETGPDAGSFTFTRTGSLTNALMVAYTISGTATTGDYEAPSGTVTFAAGSDTAVLTLTPQDDTDAEPTETLSVTLSTGSAYTVGTPSSGTISILDNDTVVTIAATDANAAELGTDPGMLTLTRTGDINAALTVAYTIGGSAVGGSGGSGDYEALSGTVTFDAGADVATVAILPVNDAEPDGDETVVLTLSAGNAYTVGTPDSASVTIVDDENVVNIQATDASATEAGADPGAFTLTRTGDLSNALTVTYTSAGSAVGGSGGSGDYQELTGSVTFAAGANTAAITVTPHDDTEAEPLETVVVNLAAGAGYFLGSSTGATVNILDNDTVISIEATDALATEAGTGPATFTLTRAGHTSEALTVSYTLSGAAGSGDYSALSGSATFAAGSATADITLTPQNDSEAELTEDVVITLSGSSAYTVGTPAGAAATILDNDTAISIEASDAAAAEEGTDPATFTLTRTGSIVEALTVSYTVSGTALSGTGGSGDYETLSGSVTFSAGSDTATVTLTPNEDLEAETGETVIVTLAAGNAYTVSTPSTAVATISDNEPIVSITASDGEAAEANSDPATFTLTRTGSTANPLTVFYAVNGTAVGNGGSGDYAALSGTAAFDAGQDTLTLTITPNDDLEVEDTETVVLTLWASTAYNVGAASSTATILDNDTVVTIGATDAGAAEAAADPGSFTLTRVGNTASALSVAYSVGGSAAAGDYNALSGTATFAAGQDTVIVSITPTDDAEVEDDETAILTLSAGSTYTVGTPETAAVSILDNDTMVTITATDADAAEAGLDGGTLTLARAGNTANALTIPYTVSGSAVGGSGTGDYEALSGSVTFAPGADTATITLTPHDDLELEDDETVVVTLSGGSAWTVGTPGAATVTINDNELPTVTIQTTDATAAEAGADTGTFTISRNGPTTNALTVAYTVSGTAAGADYQALTGTVTIPAGSASATVTLTPVNDSNPEDNETVVLTLSSGTDYVVGTPSSDSVTIVSDDLPTVTIQATDANAGETGSDSGTLTISRNGPTTNPLTVFYTVSGTAVTSDYATLTGSVTIPAGSASATVTVSPVDDAAPESSETVIVTLSSSPTYLLGVGPANDGSVTIADNDLPTVTLQATDAAAAEAATNTGTFTVSRNGPTTNPLTVSYAVSGTATSGSDYQALTGTVTIAAGSSSATITVTPVDDSAGESSETVIATVNANSAYTVGSPGSAAVTIADNDAFNGPLVAAGAVWKYLGDGSNQGTAWRGVTFNDSTWPSGPAQLGFGDSDEQTLLTAGTITYYFRHTFTVANASLIPAVTLRLLRDDGAVVHLNGQEVYRSNMPAGTIGYKTKASTAVSGAAEDTFYETSVSPLLLVNGTNVLAVEVHQSAATSPDLSFNLELLSVAPVVTVAATDATAAEPGTDTGTFTITRTGDTAAALTVAYTMSGSASSGSDYTALSGTVIIPAGSASTTVTVTPTDDATFEGSETAVLTLSSGSSYTIGASSSATVTVADNDSTTLVATASTWKYLDNGSDQGTAWQAGSFNDSTWSSGAGPLGYGMSGLGTTVGYGPDAANKYITTYFRHNFTVADASAISSLSLQLRRDDGAVVYLNGTEIARSNMPTGTITYQTQASTTVNVGDETTYWPFSVDPALLVSGTNVLAVEIHQATLTSSDIVFDLGLTAM